MHCASLVGCIEGILKDLLGPDDSDAEAVMARVKLPGHLHDTREEAVRAATLPQLLTPARLLHRPAYNRAGAIVMPSQQCTADNKRGARCKARTRFGHLCWVHLKKELGVRVKKSAIPGAGLGLVAARHFEEGEELVPYTGDLIVTPAMERTCQDSNYMFGLCDGVAIDAARTNTAVGRFVNDSQGTRLRPNTIWVVDLNRSQRHQQRRDQLSL
jgi:hypothetical protein